jgi:hypothetical protein
VDHRPFRFLAATPVSALTLSARGEGFIFCPAPLLAANLVALVFLLVFACDFVRKWGACPTTRQS